MDVCCLWSPPGPDCYSFLKTSLENVPGTPGCVRTHCILYHWGQHRCSASHDGVYKVPGWCSSHQWGQCGVCHMESSQSPEPPGSISPLKSKSGPDQPPQTPSVMHCQLKLKIGKNSLINMATYRQSPSVFIALLQLLLPCVLSPAVVFLSQRLDSVACCSMLVVTCNGIA